MSDYGIRIKNYQAASIYEYQHGLRTALDATDAMLTNSLFKDFLVDNGLNIWNNESTRDIICIEFGYGTKDYNGYLNRNLKFIRDLEGRINKENEEEINNKIENIKKQSENLKLHMDDCVEIKKNTLREMFYNDGVSITYKTHNKKGNVIKEETIHYRMLYRTPGKAKKGTCMFIREELYDLAHNFLYMGIELPDKNAPIVEIGAYSSLITSGIVGYCTIKPEEILVVEDVKTFMNSKVISVETNNKKHCIAKEIDNYQLSNEIFDGQALIDSSIFPEWGDGYILLRHHMCKMAAFNANIQLFFKDYFDDKYDTAEVTDMWGNKHYAKDIKLITTNNAMKWLKFGVSYEYWAEWVRKNDCNFGVVKTSHPSKFGEVQRTSYQMINALDIDSMPEVASCSAEYINRLKSDDKTFLEYLKENSNFSNDYEVLVALVEHNPDFIYSSYFRQRKSSIIGSYILKFKTGKTLQNADNLTIVGSPYAMLLHSVGESIYNDPTFKTEDDCIQVWTNRFEDGEYLAEFRNPFNSRNNLGYVHNVKHEYFDKYFNFGNLIIAVNMIGTDFQDRNNGSDQDSDSCYTTNQIDIVKHAKYCYKNYPTIVNNIPPEKISYDNTMDNFAKVDNSLAAAQLAIGESSNLAQLCLTYTYNFEDRIFYDYVCILSVIAQVAIDNAKRKYDIDLSSEIKYIKQKIDIGEKKYPKFWLLTKQDKRKFRTEEQREDRKKKNHEKIKDHVNYSLICPMNFLYDYEFSYYRNGKKTIPIEEFFNPQSMPKNRRKSKQVEAMIEKYSIDLYNFYSNKEEWYNKENLFLLRADFDKLINDIKKIYISKNYLDLMGWLINRALYIGAGVKSKKDIMNSKTNHNRALLLKILYTLNKTSFLECFSKNLYNDKKEDS